MQFTQNILGNENEVATIASYWIRCLLHAINHRKMIDLNVCSKLCEWKIYTLQMEAVSKCHLITDRVMIRQEPH